MGDINPEAYNFRQVYVVLLGAAAVAGANRTVLGLLERAATTTSELRRSCRTRSGRTGANSQSAADHRHDDTRRTT